MASRPHVQVTAIAICNTNTWSAWSSSWLALAASPLPPVTKSRSCYDASRRLLAGIRPGTPSVQHLHLWLTNHRLQKVGLRDDLAFMHAVDTGKQVNWHVFIFCRTVSATQNIRCFKRLLRAAQRVLGCRRLGAAVPGAAVPQVPQCRRLPQCCRFFLGATVPQVLGCRMQLS